MIGNLLNRKAGVKFVLNVWLLAVFFGASNASAQTSQFTYQGKLTDNGTATNALYDFTLTLWDSATNGAQIGPIVNRQNTPIVDGIFTVALDFGASAFNGESRFLEISLKPSGNPAALPTLLTPRQQVLSTPYAIKSLGSMSADSLSVNCVSCITSNQIGNVSGSAVSGAIPVASVPAGSASYIQNTTLSQASSNFNISGNGTAFGTLSGNIVNAATQYNLGGNRILSIAGSGNMFVGLASGAFNTSGFNNSFLGFNAGQSNTTGNNNAFFGWESGDVNDAGNLNAFFGSNAGGANTTGSENSFFGAAAGLSNTTSSFNSFFGRSAGRLNSTGSSNSFFGNGAGFSNTTGNENSFFGQNAGVSNTTSSFNSFFGRNAGKSNTTGSQNSFFGTDAGFLNTDGSLNSFFGRNAGSANNNGQENAFFGNGAGQTNTTGDKNAFFGNGAGFTNSTGSSNTMIGNSANLVSGNFTNAAAIGANALVGQSNSMVLGSIAGINGAISDTRVGIGTTQPSERLTIKTATNSYGVIHTDGAITVGSYVGGTGSQPVGGWLGTKTNHPLNFFVGNGGAAMTLETSGFLSLNNVDAGGSLHLCLGNDNHISFCSSSLRYKTNVQAFLGGLDIVNRLRPITFDWKVSGVSDLGFGAEEVAQIEPLLTFRNPKGEIEGVKYSQLNAVLVNAIKEQQAQIEQQRREIETIRQRQQELEALKKLICADRAGEAVCKQD